MAPFPSFTKTWHTSSYPSISPTRPELSLAGKTVLITGGSAGIGLAISKAVASAGAKNLFILGRRVEVLSTAKADIEKISKDTAVYTYSTDVSNESQVTETFAKIKEILGESNIDIFIPCAGFMTGPRPIGTETAEEWLSNFNINILGIYLTTTAFLKLASPDSVIANISTAIVHLDAEFLASWGVTSYAATKIAGAKIMEFVQAENKGLRLVNIHPGQVTETEMGTTAGNARAHIDDAELAGNFVVWACSPEASFLKGKFVWVNWDVDELIESKQEILGGKILILGLDGFSSVKY